MFRNQLPAPASITPPNRRITWGEATWRQEVRTFLQEQLPDAVRGPMYGEEDSDRDEAMNEQVRTIPA